MSVSTRASPTNLPCSDFTQSHSFDAWSLIFWISRLCTLSYFWIVGDRMFFRANAGGSGARTPIQNTYPKLSQIYKEFFELGWVNFFNPACDCGITDANSIIRNQSIESYVMCLHLSLALSLHTFWQLRMSYIGKPPKGCAKGQDKGCQKTKGCRQCIIFLGHERRFSGVNGQ